MDNTIVTRNGEPVNGPEWNVEVAEYAVYLDGERVTWAETETAGWAVYSAALAARKAHLSRPQNRADLVQYVA